jgi:dienelactone hydrolase
MERAMTQGVARGRPLAAGALRRSWPVGVALALIAGCVLLAGATREGRATVFAGLFLFDILGPSPVQPLQLFTPDPIVEEIRFSSAGRTVEANIYRPGKEGRHGVVILSMGVRAWPLDSPRLVRWGNDLARAGVVLVTIDSPELRFDEVNVREVEDLVLAYLYLEDRPYTDQGRIGFLGVSVGGTLALLAAADERIADRVHFVDSIGAYFDVLELLRWVTTGESRGWPASEVSATVLRRQVIDYVTDGSDRETLNQLFYYRRHVDRSRIEALTPRGRAVYDLLSNTDPDRYSELLAGIGVEGHAALRGLSPVYVADRLRARLLVLHSRRDHHVPFAEGEALRDATRERLGTELASFSAFDHVDPRLSKVTPALASDGVKLYYYLTRLILRLR